MKVFIIDLGNKPSIGLIKHLGRKKKAEIFG